MVDLADTQASITTLKNHISTINLLKNAEQCLSRLDTIFVDSIKSEFSEMRRYLEAHGLDRVVRELTLRTEVYKLALWIPVLVSVVHDTHEELGQHFSEIGFKTVERWAERLSRDNLRLAEYDEISIPFYKTETAICAATEGKDNATNTLQNLDYNGLNRERKDLVQIIALMIGNAMVMIKKYNDGSVCSSPKGETSKTPGYLNVIAGEQSTSASQSAPAQNPSAHLAHIIRSAPDVVDTRASPINTIYESINTRPSVSLSPVSPLEHFYSTANVVADKAFVVHRDETIKSESEPSEIKDDDENSEEYHMEPSYEYLHLGPDSLIRTDIEGGWRVM